MHGPKDLEPEALELLLASDFVWDATRFEFRRARRPEFESTQAYREGSPPAVSYEELRDHNLISVRPGSVCASAKAEGLRWLGQHLNVLRN